MDGINQIIPVKGVLTSKEFCSKFVHAIHKRCIKMNKIQYCNLNIMALYLHVRTVIRARIYIKPITHL